MIASQFYQLARKSRKRHLAYLDRELSSLPHISLGRRKVDGKDTDVVRVYKIQNGKRNKMQFMVDSPKATEWLHRKKYQEVLLARKEKIEFREVLETSGPNYTPTNDDKSVNRYSKEIFDRLLEKCEKNIQNGYIYDGHLFRSKSELMMAQCFKELGLEYKYDVIVSFGDETFLIDFAVYCPETDRFFFIEHFGRMSDETYRTRTFHKITTYSRNNLIEGLDILYTYELSDGGFFIDVIKSKLLSIIAAQLLLEC